MLCQWNCMCPKSYVVQIIFYKRVEEHFLSPYASYLVLLSSILGLSHWKMEEIWRFWLIILGWCNKSEGFTDLFMKLAYTIIFECIVIFILALHLKAVCTLLFLWKLGTTASERFCFFLYWVAQCKTSIFDLLTVTYFLDFFNWRCLLN